MILVDTALKERASRNEPIRIGIIGNGFLGRGLLEHITHAVPGMEVGAIFARRPDTARKSFADARMPEPAIVSTKSELEDALGSGKRVITDDPFLVAEAQGIDAIVEATGAIEFGSQVVLRAIQNGKHIVVVNAELDGTVGPILKDHADRAGVIYTGCDGDQPGTQMNLYRWLRGIGFTPLLCGNIKGLYDPYRTPATQKGFADQWGLNPLMATSFADGTKISFEQALVANATGMKIAQRGMLGYEHRGPIDKITDRYDIDELRALGGIVDYALGATPGPGIYVLAELDNPRQKHYLDLYKMGPGPLYCFYVPMHLAHFEVPLSIARAVLFNDPTVTPLDGPVVEVVAAAKTDLKAGQKLDGYGEYCSYGLAENTTVSNRDALLPIGVIEGCTLRRDIGRDQILTYQDVELPEGRLVDRLRAEQGKLFGSSRSGQETTRP